MDKQKIFWVILSVTVFVVVVLVVGVFLLKKEPTAVAAAPTTPSTAPGSGLYEFGRDAGAAEGDTEVLRFVIGSDGAAGGVPEAETTTDGAATGAADGAGASGAELLATTSLSTSTAAAGAESAAKPAATTAKPATAAKPAATPSTAVAVKPAAPTVQYWIQTGSYKSQTRAEELSQTLTAKGLAGRVFSFSQADATWFRVRIGPYVNKQEAEKFLAIVRKIQGLEASFISQVSGNRSAN